MAKGRYSKLMERQVLHMERVEALLEEIASNTRSSQENSSAEQR